MDIYIYIYIYIYILYICIYYIYYTYIDRYRYRYVIYTQSKICQTNFLVFCVVATHSGTDLCKYSL